MRSKPTKDEATDRPGARTVALRVSEPAASELWLAERLDRLIDGFGNNRVASLLGVSRSQPSRWRRGEERISADKQRSVIDLDFVMARLLQLYPREQAEIWLTSHNAHLGSRPIDVLRLRGAAGILPAIDAEAQGAYA
jgi:transcriptional regulator with XRE-family HTH domain